MSVEHMAGALLGTADKAAAKTGGSSSAEACGPAAEVIHKMQSPLLQGSTFPGSRYSQATTVQKY